MEQEIIEKIADLASCKDVNVILTESEKPVWLLTYDKVAEKFIKNQIGEY